MHVDTVGTRPSISFIVLACCAKDAVLITVSIYVDHYSMFVLGWPLIRNSSDEFEEC